MRKEVVAAGLLGGIVALIWLFVSNAVLPVKSGLVHRSLPIEAQLEIHPVLEHHVTDRGTYSVPYVGPDQEDAFPDYRSRPVYSITYDGFTHGGAGEGSIRDSLTVLLGVFVPSFIAAWMLASASSAIRSRYSRRVGFVAVIGVIVAFHADLLQTAFGPTSRDYLTFLAVNDLVTWTLAAFVIAARVRGRA
jgi:hypothetical protein